MVGVVLALFATHVAGFLVLFPHNLWPIVGLETVSNISVQLSLVLGYSLLAWHLTPAVLRAVLGFFDFIIAKILLRPKVSIHHRVKLRWMSRRAAKNSKLISKFSFLFKFVAGSVVFVTIYLSWGTVNLIVWLFFALVFLSQGFRGREFPRLFRSSSFWLHGELGVSFIAAIVLGVSFLSGVVRHQHLRDDYVVQAISSDQHLRVSLITYGELGPVFFDRDNSTYIVLVDQLVLRF